MPYLPTISKTLLEDVAKDGSAQQVFELFSQAFVNELYERDTFDFMNDLNTLQKFFLAFEYVKSNVEYGGFIQLIVNKYVNLLLPVHEGLTMLGDDNMGRVIDDVLKVYVLNIDGLDKEFDLKEFAQLYNEYLEFEELDTRFLTGLPHTLDLAAKYALLHKEELAVIDNS